VSGAAADWRRFLTGRYAAFGTLAVSDAIAVALAGDGLAIPFVTTLGASPALATLIGLFPFVGGILQAFVPAILRRNHGDLRGLTIVIAAIGLMRPLLYIAVVVLIWAGLLSAIGGILLIAIGFGVGATAQALAGANVQTWFGRILPERERRFVAPRALAIQFGLGSVLLVPVALMVRVGEADWGVMIYAPAFVGALVASLAFIRAMRKLPRPGALAPERSVRGGSLSTPVRRFIRTNAIAALGAGFAPYLSIYAIVVLNQSAAYAILLSAVGSAAALVGALVIGNWLERGSASRLYRASLIIRGVGMASSALAGPWNPLAPVILVIVMIVVTVGFAAGMLSAQERLLRLAEPGEVVRAQSTFGAVNAACLAAGQAVGVGVLAVFPIAYPTYVVIFLVTGAFRLVAAATADVGDGWDSATRLHYGDEIATEPALESQR
jgi:hypothetical protein